MNYLKTIHKPLNDQYIRNCSSQSWIKGLELIKKEFLEYIYDKNNFKNSKWDNNLIYKIQTRSQKRFIKIIGILKQYYEDFNDKLSLGKYLKKVNWKIKKLVYKFKIKILDLLNKKNNHRLYL